jgi:hypothetical protein
MSLRGVASTERGQVTCSRLCYARVMNTQKIGVGAVLVDRVVGFGVRGKGSRMKLVHIALVVTLACCGGKVVENGSGDNSGGGGDFVGGGSGNSTGVGGASNFSGGGSAGSGGGGGSGGGSTGDDASSLSEASASDTAVVCALPPASDFGGAGQCTFCKNEWYCPQPRMPLPQCQPNPTPNGPCTSACIECTNDGSASVWLYCVGGTFTPGGISSGFSCSP